MKRSELKVGAVVARLRLPFWTAVNALQGCGFGGEHGVEARPGTCPYPIRHNWSVRACRKAGDCGCDCPDVPLLKRLLGIEP